MRAVDLYYSIRTRVANIAIMSFLQSFLHATTFRTPLLRTLVPSVALAYGIQTAVAVPSIVVQSERFYDLSGSLTYLSCTALSLTLPYLRAKSAGAITGGLAEYLSAPAPGQAGWWWRQAVLSAAAGVWATRRMYTDIDIDIDIAKYALVVDILTS